MSEAGILRLKASGRLNLSRSSPAAATPSASWSPRVAVVFLCLCLASQQLTDSAAWAAAMMVGGRHSAAACGVLDTGGNVVGGIGALLVPLSARALGWPVALGIASLFALVGAVIWLWIEADRPADAEPALPASRKGGFPAAEPDCPPNSP